ncbi:amino acid adenylation domain-containing protein [Kitasatospora sp. NPDC052896]|uniref:amino acid adenylation domain-containing protein n=1 Tax=Kitasatospora sp. NPDC052896 TaxID=3364061 RepID=UPI0037CC877E
MPEPTSTPGLPLRAAVAELWRGALGLDQVQDDHNFFFEGGHSVLAVETAIGLRALTGVELDLDILYEYPEFGSLMAALEARTTDRPGARRGEPRPLTAAEERLWVVEQLHPGTPVYHVAALLHCTTALDPDRLRSALDALADRHEALRRGFEAPGRAFALEGAPVPLRRLAAGGLADPELRRLLDEEARLPFDLAQPPLLRALLVRRGPQDGDLLLLTVHHLVCDGLSLSLLEADLRRFYTGSAPDESPAGTLPQGVSVGPRDSTEALEYWRGALAGLPEGPSLPYDRPRPALLGVTGAVHRLEFGAEALAAMTAVAAQERLSPFMAWVAAYLAGLAAVTGDRDLVIAVPVSSRGPGELAEVGMFVDTLPLRLELPPGTTARGLARLVRRVVTGALAHQQVPFQTMMDELRLGGDLSRAPLAQLALSYQDAADWGWPAGEPQASRELLPTGTAKYELLWSVTRRGERVLAELEYHTELFSDHAAARLHQDLLAAIEVAFADPDAELPSSARPEEPYRAVPELVHRQALERPEAVAVEHGDEQLTYGQLDERADAVAAALMAAGLRRGAVVAVPMPRGTDAVTACLGVLRAGCAYLPLDTDQPDARLHAALRTGAEAALVAGEATAERLANLLPVHRLDRIGSPGRAALAQVGAVELLAEDAAYVISTSGSTGRPKGVLVPHGAISRLVPNGNFAPVEATDRMAHLSNPAFDAATFEIWGALAAGATLVVVDREVALSPTRLRTFLTERRITVMFLTTSLLNQVADFAPDAFRHLRTLVFGGEKHDARRLEKVLACRPPGRMVNGYGPTENTTFSTYHEVTLDDVRSGTVPIGRPISRSTAYALGPDGELVGVGEVGELYVGGAGLARGYHNAPEATADSFVPDPFDPRGGQRLYRTGDQVRVLPDGGFEYLGRLDDQVKIRGFRVELGEIELAIGRQPGVRDVVVTSRATADSAEIIAYVTADAPADAPADPATFRGGLRERLRGELPDYMVPTLVLLDELPVNANGKLDRRALPEPTATDRAAPPDRTAHTGHTTTRPAPEPADPLLGELAALWCEVLDLDRVDPEDNFLTLGGHSIKALRLLARIDEESGVQLELAAFLRYPTLRGTAALIRQAAGHEFVWSSDVQPH